MEDRLRPYDELWFALKYCNVDDFKKEDIVSIVAEVCGENESYSWWWLVELQDGSFSLAEGNCDYTGFDCRGSMRSFGIFKTAKLAAMAAPEIEAYTNREIRKHLLGQLTGKIPFGLYIQEND